MARIQRLSVSVTTPLLLLGALVWLLSSAPNPALAAPLRYDVLAPLSGLNPLPPAIKPSSFPAPKRATPKVANATTPIVQVLAPIQQRQLQDGGIIDCPAGVNYGASGNSSLGPWGPVHPSVGESSEWGLLGVGKRYGEKECGILVKFASLTVRN